MVSTNGCMHMHAGGPAAGLGSGTVRMALHPRDWALRHARIALHEQRAPAGTAKGGRAVGAGAVGSRGALGVPLCAPVAHQQGECPAVRCSCFAGKDCCDTLERILLYSIVQACFQCPRDGALLACFLWLQGTSQSVLVLEVCASLPQQMWGKLIRRAAGPGGGAARGVGGTHSAAGPQAPVVSRQ